jgi:hypothetical protein
MKLAVLLTGGILLGSLIGCQSGDSSAGDAKVKAMLGSTNGRVDMSGAGGHRPKGAMEQKKAGEKSAGASAQPGTTPPGP